MKSKRYLAASVPVNDSHMWVLGGHDGDRRLQSTEFVDLEGNNMAGPDMPGPISNHAIVAFGDSTYLLIGGRTNDGGGPQSSDKTYFFFEKTQNWAPGPSLITGRYGHTAGFITDDITAEKYIVVIGGKGGSELDSTEVLKYHESTEWQQGKHSNNLIFYI